MKYPIAFQELIYYLKKLPGVGTKTAERYGYFLMNMDEEILQEFGNAIINFKENIHHCKICGNLSDGDYCDICQDQSRDISTICIVETSKDLFAMENIREYRGSYHVLNGTISIIDGVTLDDLNIKTLYDRLESVKEIIIATNPTSQGETTALYLAKVLQRYPQIKVTRIAHGLPIGSNLDYADELTLLKSFEGRKEM
ncbi:MAG: recombination mediator RecR [Erysipelotrichaceae bacterium]|nr:recombination mediator RecR [Erysipelotrichaceae bacterium]MDD3810116.1 recombination mediator RecR [Erysipelotrichaceae bacterium]